MAEKRKQGRPRGMTTNTPSDFSNRFQKFYYKHREQINNERRELYQCRRVARVCVRCGEPLAEKNKLFCTKHVLPSKKNGKKD